MTYKTRLKKIINDPNRPLISTKPITNLKIWYRNNLQSMIIKDTQYDIAYNIYFQYLNKKIYKWAK